MPSTLPPSVPAPATSSGAPADVRLLVDPVTQLVTVSDPSPTVSVVWDRAVQLAVIEDSPGPTIASRAYAAMHTAMYDAWAASDATAQGVHHDASAALGEAATADAMSLAAYTVLSELFPEQEARFAAELAGLGLTPDEIGPAADLGRAAGGATLTAIADDGANQANDYAPIGPDGAPLYTPVNGAPDDIADLARWTPEHVPIDEPGGALQSFLTPQWGGVTPFAIEAEALLPEGPEPFLLVDGATLDIDARTVRLADGTILTVSPDLVGTIINPAFIAQAEAVVAASANLSDEDKLIAEFWEDGGGTSFPPGTFMTFGQFVSARDDHGQGEDARMFLALANAVFDAGIATWEAKVFYDYARPVRVVRELGELGLIGEYDEVLGGHAIQAWGGPGQGTQTILASDFVTYQTPAADPSPPFAEYTSGHSSFSAAGAEILRLFSLSDAFGGAVAFESNASRFEPQTTPGDTIRLAWDTFTAAADEAGLSRIYGGIHFEDGDLNGRTLGREVARDVFERAMGLIQGIGDGAGDDTLAGTDGDELMAGLGGDDTLTTGAGRDGVVFMAGHGNDVVTDFAVGGTERAERGPRDPVADGPREGPRDPDVPHADERGPRDPAADGPREGPRDPHVRHADGDFDTLVLSGLGELDGEYAGRADLLDLLVALETDGNGGTDAVVGREDVTFVFGEAGQVRLAGIVDDLGGRDTLLALGGDDARTHGTNLDDSLRGTQGDARYEGGRGDDVIRTGGGRDEVVFRFGDGADRVRDFDVDGGGERSFDTLRLDGFGALDGEYSTNSDLLDLVAALENDGDAATGARHDRRDLRLDLGDDSVHLRRVVDDLDATLLAEAGADWGLG